MKRLTLPLAALVIAFCSGLLAASIDSTGSAYKPSQGLSYTQGVVIQQSKDGYNALPVNASYPLQMQESFLFTHLAAASTTLVKTGAGVLRSVTVNSKGTVASTVTIYDSLTATGTVLAVIDSLNLSGGFTYQAAFTTGLTVVVTGTVAPDITVSYR